MRDTTREAMWAILTTIRGAWNAGAISGPGAELVLLAAATAMDPDAFEKFSTPDLRLKMQAMFEALRETYRIEPSGSGPDSPVRTSSALAAPVPRLLEGWPERRAGVAC